MRENTQKNEKEEKDREFSKLNLKLRNRPFSFLSPSISWISVWNCDQSNRILYRSNWQITNHITSHITPLWPLKMDTRWFLHLLALPLLLTLPTTHSSTWTQFRQNRQHHGFVTTSTPPPKLKIIAYHTGNYVTSSPAISSDGKTIYVGSLDRHLHAINVETGQMIWKYKTGSSINSSPCISPDGSIIFVGSNDHKLHAVDARNGEKIWEYLTENWVWSSPTINSAGKVVFVGSLDGKMYAINVADGSKNFTYDTGGEIWSSPILSNDETILYFGSLDKVHI